MHTQSLCRSLVYSAAGTFILLNAASAASASLILTVNGTPITDGGAGDSNPLPDHITYIQSNANYIVDIQIGTSNDPGTSKMGVLSINSTIRRTSSAGVLPFTLSLVDNGYTLPVSNHYTLTSSFSPILTPGANSAIENFTSTVSSPTLSTPLQSFSTGPGGLPVSFNNTQTLNFSSLSHPYSLAEAANFSLGPNAVATLNGQTIITPEPATIGLLGIGSIGLLRRRRS